MGAPAGWLDCYVDPLIAAARATLAEQRREFKRGEIPDLDALEDALAPFADDPIRLERPISGHPRASG